MRQRDREKLAASLRQRPLSAGDYCERRNQWFLMVALKYDEIDWLGGAPERLEMKQVDFMRLVMQCYLESAPEQLPPDREVNFSIDAVRDLETVVETAGLTSFAAIAEIEPNTRR